MRKPDENLDEYIVRPDKDESLKAPRAVSLQRTGEVEHLKPLTLQEIRSKRVDFRGAYQPLWFRRFLAVGSGALFTIALVLISAILVAINDPDVGTEIATSMKQDDQRPQLGEPFGFELFSPSTSAPAVGRVNVSRSKAVRRLTRPRVLLPAKPIRRSRPLPQLEQSTFVPTTLVIYPENGVIYTRIEPWLQAGTNKIPAFDN